MNDKPKIILGLLIFFGVFTFPFWYNHLSASAPPKVALTEKAKAAKKCVADTDFMRTQHMKILNDWRNTVVREGKTVYTGADGKEYVASLSNTCMDCHSDKAEFCDKCHTYTSTVPYCWDCHTFPEVKK
jgi:hypothetical protein